MSLSTPAHCPHERRPGTTVCLHCRHEERELSRVRRQKLFAQIGVGMVGVIVVAIAGVAGATAIQGRRPEPDARPRAEVRRVAAANAADSTQVVQQGTAVRADSARPMSLTPVIAEGRSELRDSLYAMRAGSNIEVYFDRPMARTRRADKFEHIVRVTLPQLYGANADSVLARISEGQMASATELLTVLPERGLHWPVGNGMTMSLYPVTRPGQDGPLVVTYRVSVASTP